MAWATSIRSKGSPWWRGPANRTETEQSELTRLQDGLQRDESYLEYLIELERQLGISSYFF